MKRIYLYLAIMSLILSPILVSGNNTRSVQPAERGIDLDSCAFAIPAEQLNFTTTSTFTLSFWVNIKEFNHDTNGTQFVSIRDVTEGYPMNNWGWMWSEIGNPLCSPFFATIKLASDNYDDGEILELIEFKTSQWSHFAFVFDYSDKRNLAVYVDGKLVYKLNTTNSSASWKSNYDIIIGGTSYLRAFLNANIDKVQLYGKALSEAEVKESITAPLDDESLLGYWDFEDDCTVDDDGFMTADSGLIKATMYEIVTAEGGGSIGKEVTSFTFGEGVDVDVVTGIEESTATATNSKAYIANGVLNIENSDGINMVEVYDTTGRLLVSTNGGGETGVQISLPTYAKGVLMVKVNSEALKVVAKTM